MRVRHSKTASFGAALILVLLQAGVEATIAQRGGYAEVDLLVLVVRAGHLFAEAIDKSAEQATENRRAVVD